MLARRNGHYNNGDTIIEVLFAITIFSLVAVAAMTLMNKGLATSQRSLELTAVRQQIDGQAEALRLLHGAYIAAYSPDASYPAASLAGRYKEVLDMPVVQASEFGAGDGCTMPSGSRFVIDPLTAAVRASPTDIIASPDTYARIVTNEAGDTFQRSEGLYVQAVPSSASSSGGVGFVDFHIRACWDVLGSSDPMTLGTIVRLYDPAP